MDDKQPNIYSDPDLLKQAQEFFNALSHNVTNDSKNIIFHIIEKSKKYYYSSENKEDWDRLLNSLQDVINDFENASPDTGELKLIALQKNLEELETQEKTNKS